MTTVYRIVTGEEWRVAQRDGEFRGSEHDRRDGFIHFSAADQVADTARKYYASLPDLLVLYVRTQAISPPSAWRWEPSRGGALFPHLYAPLPVTAVHHTERVTFGPDGTPQLPPFDP